VISDLAGPTSLLDIGEMLADQLGDKETMAAVKQARKFTSLLQTFTVIADASKSIGDVKLNLGSLSLAATVVQDPRVERNGLQSISDDLIDTRGFKTLATAVSAAAADKTDGGKASAAKEVEDSIASAKKSASDTDAGDTPKPTFSFPVYDDPKSLIGLLFGRKVDLVTFVMPRYQLANYTYSQYFPTPVPFVFVEIAGKLNASVQLSFGYDTAGLQSYAKTKQAKDLLDGFYIVDGVGPE